MQHVDGRAVNDKTPIAVSIEKRINMQIPPPALTVTLPQSDNSLQSSFLSNGFPFGLNGTGKCEIGKIKQTEHNLMEVRMLFLLNATVVSDKNSSGFNRSNLISTVTLPTTQSIKVN